MNDEPDVSLIIPVYNVEKYLRKALVSVENQTFKDFKVIIVNDGSTDGSYDIIEEFTSRNSNFLVINQPNRGVGAARNAGIKASRSKYISFMDSDDFLEPDFLKKMYVTALKYDSDIVCCNFNFYYPKINTKVCWPFMAVPGVYSSDIALKKITSCISMLSFAWNKFFKRELFVKNGIEFFDMYYEDSATSPRLFYFARKIVTLSDVLYNYVMHDSSITHCMDADKINDFIKSLGILRNFYEKHGIYRKFRRRMRAYSQRLSLLNYYNVFAMHLRSANFAGFLQNISAVKKSIKYFASDDYSPYDDDFSVDLPLRIKEPKEF
ncbi:MAG: glycosyltransferase [Oscillospiraceae bacterium]|jgi:glycosyltransferase involved in cell wall biosynthesis|nr:glycosyltransferase [Oscillospiraceae bacterium]